MSRNFADAFGREIYDYYTRRTGYEIVERDDGLIEIGAGPAAYFADFTEWPDYEKKAMKFVRGRVLDIGCGAGRHSQYLQKKGFECVGIDNSPLAVKVCRLRGIKKVKLMDLNKLNTHFGIFDTVLMLGNSFAILSDEKKAHLIIKKLFKLTSPGGLIIAQTRDPYQTDMREHKEYHSNNKKKGKPAGWARIRVRYKKYVTPWMEYLFYSRLELDNMLSNTGWKISKIIRGQTGIYLAIIIKS
ncbi:MAG: class I SAM-dependent methyltransferase [candidate division Zixibacteria bacterium]|nr:class I SAM-dependent methyltransferase [candidate division Zixibacteria bacterium]MDD5427187.1 class I SAM-dependent methyltransferase [candidate division Zixibacteria bacterium]